MPVVRLCVCVFVLAPRSLLQAAEEHHSATVAALKQGWAAELKRQAANWEAAAAGKQEAWRMAKLAEIKEQTVKASLSLVWVSAAAAEHACLCLA